MGAITPGGAGGGSPPTTKRESRATGAHAAEGGAAESRPDRAEGDPATGERRERPNSAKKKVLLQLAANAANSAKLLFCCSSFGGTPRGLAGPAATPARRGESLQRRAGRGSRREARPSTARAQQQPRQGSRPGAEGREGAHPEKVNVCTIFCRRGLTK